MTTAKIHAELASLGHDSVESYQRFHALPETGVVDEATCARLALPRCFQPDVMGDASSYGWPPDVLKDLTLWVDVATIPSGVVASQVGTDVANELGKWEALAPDAMSFRWAAAAAEARIIVCFGVIDGPRNVLALTELPVAGVTRVRLMFDAAESWENGIRIDVVALHELGHALGLVHVPATTPAIMNPVYNAALAAPQPADIQAFYAVAGITTPPVPSPLIPSDALMLEAGNHVVVIAGSVTIDGKTVWEGSLTDTLAIAKSGLYRQCPTLGVTGPW